MIYLGIDPGLSGAFALYTLDSGALDLMDMPTLTLTVNGKAKRQVDLHATDRWLRFHPADQVVIENPHALPGQGVTSCFNFGFTCGVLQGLVVAHGLAMLPVAPATWKKRMGLTADKDAARRMASRVFPAYSHLWARKKDDGRAEAALLAWYGSRLTT